VASSRAWQQLAQADDEARLPSPAFHGAALGGLCSLLVACVSAMRPQATFGWVLRTTLTAVGSSVGATALAVLLLPVLSHAAQTSQLRVARYASAASLPLSASGLVVLQPSWTVSLIAIALLGVLAYRSGSLGADVLLRLKGADRTRTAALTSLVATLPAFFVVLCHAR
jgi:hypothetical protein